VVASAYPGGDTLGRGGAAYARLARKEAERALERAAARLADGAEPELRLLPSGDPASTLGDRAREIGAAVVVLGSARGAVEGRAAPGRSLPDAGSARATTDVTIQTLRSSSRHSSPDGRGSRWLCGTCSRTFPEAAPDQAGDALSCCSDPLECCASPTARTTLAPIGA
jgi:hypothetical protein